MARFRIKSTAFTQTGRIVRILPGAVVSVTAPDGSNAAIYLTEDAEVSAGASVAADSLGAYDFWLSDERASYTVTISDASGEIASYPVYAPKFSPDAMASRAIAEAANIPSPAIRFDVVTPYGLTVRYVEDDGGTALTTGDGRKWSPDGDATPDHWKENASPGTTDMTTAINAATAFSRRVVLIGPDYLCSAPIVIPSRGSEIVGQGSEATRIRSVTDGHNIVHIDVASGQAYSGALRGMSIIYGNGAENFGTRTGGAHIYSDDYPRNFVFEDLELVNFYDGIAGNGWQFCFFNKIVGHLYGARSGDGLKARSMFRSVNTATTGDGTFLTDTHFTDVNISGYKSNVALIGTVLVNGAGQTGTTLVIDGLTATPAVNDVLTLAGVTGTYTVSAVNSYGSGAANLTISPSLATSPADNAAVTVRRGTNYALQHIIYTDRADGLYAVNCHFMYADYHLYIDAEDDSGSGLLGRMASLMFANTYFDTCGVSHIVIAGALDTQYRQVKFTGCQFREARGATGSVYINAPVDGVHFVGCTMRDNIYSAIICGPAAQGAAKNLIVAGCQFANNNSANSASHGDIVWRGIGGSITGNIFEGGGASGYSILLGTGCDKTDAANNNTSLSTAQDVTDTSGGDNWIDGKQYRTNANGEYEKSKDGGLECWHSLASGTGGDTTWTYPHAFKAATVPVVGATVASLAGPAIAVANLSGAPAATSCAFNVLNSAGARQALTARLSAKGRWK